MRLAIYEILEQAWEIDDLEELRAFFQANDSPALRTVLEYAYDKKLEWLLPYGAPPFKLNEDVEAHGQLYSVVRKLNQFVKSGPYPNLPEYKRQMLFIQFLETIHPKDAELIVKIKDGKFPYRFNPYFLQTTFPGIRIEKLNVED